MTKSTTFQVWGKPPPSVWNALTEAQRKALDRYIDKTIIEPTYRIAYDCGFEAGQKKLPTTRRSIVGPAGWTR